MAGKPQILSKGQKDEVVQILCTKLLKWIIISFTILAGVTGMSLWGIRHRVEEKMEELVAEQFKEPQIQEVVRKVAAERASVLMVEQITPEVTKFKAEITSVSKEVKQIETVISEAKIAIDEVRSISDFSLLLINASNDDRASFDALHKIADMENHKFHEIADRSIMQIITSIAATDNLETFIKWKEFHNLDPANASLTELINVFDKSFSLDQPTILKTIWKQERFPKVEKLDFLQKTIAKTQSLRTLSRACKLMNKEAKLDKNIFVCDLYLKWWEENKESYNENSENQPANSPDKK